MTKAVSQGLFILTLIIGLSIAEALLPLALPEAQAPNRFYTPDELEGTLAGWQECRADGLKLARDRTATQIAGHCTNGYAVPIRAIVDISDIRADDERGACAFKVEDQHPHHRFLSATIKNRESDLYVARVRVEALKTLNDRARNTVDVWLEPGAKAHRCLGISFGFDTAAEADLFDQRVQGLQAGALAVYGVSKDPLKKPESTPSPRTGKLPVETTI